MNKDFLFCAIELACQNVKQGKGGPFGAVIVKEGKIIARATNTVTTSNDPTAHAEVNAIREACRVLGTFDLSGCEIYSSCEPCPMCLSAIYWARIDRVYYSADKKQASKAGFDDGFIYEELSKPIIERKIKEQKVECENSIEPFALWEQKVDKIEY